jgi:tetratricopeptide (TPR) repeat protein
MLYNNWRVLLPILFLTFYSAAALAQNARWENYMKGAKNAFEKGDYFKAEELSLSAINEAQNSTDEDELLAITYSNLALTYQNMEKYPQAKIYYYKSLSLHEKLFGKDNSRVATLLNNLASLYFVQHNFSKAKILFERSLAINEKAFGMEHPSLATNLDNLASIYFKQGNLEKAEAFYQRALAIREKSLGPNSPETAVSLMNLATLYRSRGDLERGETLMNRASAILGKTGAQAQPGTVQPPQPESLATKPSLPARKIRTEQSGEETPEEEKTPVQPPEEPRFFVNPGGIAYHYRWCPFVKGRWENAEEFSSAEQVARAGFRPCRRCRPPHPNGCP